MSEDERALHVANDLAVFADIGTDAPSVEPTQRGASIRLIRQGEMTEIAIARHSDALIESWGDKQLKHVNMKALLASERYGNLRDWAAKQAAFLDQEAKETGSLIDISGHLNDPFTVSDVQSIDEDLCTVQNSDSTRVLLIDGPAGIGKTQFITSLAKQRAESYLAKRRPLVLHVQSRGRTLSYLYDLVAFSLQRIRLDVTFDQIPILAKHGLVTLAIDGFDELADPDGYDNAWSQVSDLIEILRGYGSLILAGRETFIGRDRVLKDIASLRADKDQIDVLTLQPPNKATAVRWLVSQGWTDEQVQTIEDYLEPNSLALRPFFLKTLSDPEIAHTLSSSVSSSVLAILMDAMIDREVGKFGEAVERVLSWQDRRKYLISLLSESARDMAEANSASISDATLAWLVDVAIPVATDETINRILKARSHALAFFTNDDRRGYRRFYHDKFYEYFLSLATIDMVVGNQSGRILSRNILGSSFLETFGDVVSSALSEHDASEFCKRLLLMLDSYPPIDRTRRNLGSLAIAALPIAELVAEYKISDIDLDECRAAGTASGGLVRNAVVSQFDCRGANLTAVRFENTSLMSLIADNDTVLPDGFPEPQQIRDVSSTMASIFSPEERQAWILAHLENPPIEDDSLVPASLRQHPALKLLHKACRIRQYWLRRGDDIFAARILDDDWWPLIEEFLADSDLLKVEIRQASGTDARFIHIRQADDILAENKSDPAILKLYKGLTSRLNEDDGQLS